MISLEIPVSSGVKTQGSMGEHKRNNVNLREDKFEEHDSIYDEYLEVDEGYKIIFVYLKFGLYSKYYKREERLLLIENGEFQELNYVLDYQKYFGQQICNLKNVLFLAT